MTLVAAAPASAKYRVGIGEQKPQCSTSPTWQSLKLKRVRFLVPWDYAKHRGQRDEVNFFMSVRASTSRTCSSRSPRAAAATSATATRRRRPAARRARRSYKKAFLAFDKAYPWVKTYSAWNEINHKSQPTFKSPKKAAGYYNVLRKYTRKKKIRVMAADMLDTGNMARYLGTFKRHMKGSPKLWGLHNYGDVNRRRSSLHEADAALRAR